MKTKFAREIALLMVPVLLIGGAAWWRNRSGSPLSLSTLGDFFDAGPRRLKFSRFQPAELSVDNMKRGYDWSTSTRVRLVGRFDAPLGWKVSATVNPGDTRDLRVVYRQGNTWATLPKRREERSISVSTNLDTQARTFAVDLKNVPVDADEVRLHGRFQEGVCYSGTVPSGWKIPKDIQIFGPNKLLTVRSEPFDVQIKGEGEPMPQSPQLSRVSPITFVKAYYQLSSFIGGVGMGGQIYLQFHRDSKFGLPDESKSPSLLSYAVRDGNGKKLKLCNYDGKGCGSTPAGYGIMTGERYSAKIPESDFLINVLSGEEPPGGWAKHKGPFTLEVEFSDEGNWPVKVKVPVRWDGPLENDVFPLRR
jgi:hypothetical protein